MIPRDSFSKDEIEWTLSQLPPAGGDVLELGVGTGRVIIPLAEHLAGKADSRAVGVDASPTMIERMIEADVAGVVTGVVADIRSVRLPEQFDLVLCVCNTLGMSVDEGSERQIFATARYHLREGGRFIVEVQSSEAVRRVFGQSDSSYFAPYRGDRRGLVSFGRVDDDVLTMTEVWIDGGTATTFIETVRLLAVDEIVACARDAGFELLDRAADLSGSSTSTPTLHDVLVFQAI